MRGRGPSYLNAGVCQLVLAAAVATPVLAGVTAMRPASSQDAPAQQAAPQDPPVQAVQTQERRLNPTGRAMRIVAPLSENGVYLGDVELQINTDDSLDIAGWQVVEQLARIMDPVALEGLRPAATPGLFVPLSRFQELGFPLRFDPALLELSIQVPVAARARQTIGLANLDRDVYGDFATPEPFSAYVNLRMNSDYVHVGSDTGFTDPTFFVDSAARINNSFVIENEASWRGEGDFQREGTRVVYDDVANLNRWIGGDLLPQSRGFQGVRDMAGLSVERVYGLLDPQRKVAPRGGRSFTLDREATVEAVVNGRVVRTLRLQPGAYDVSDFPFVQGSNDVDLVISDASGRRELLSFSVFVDRTQLAPVLSEYGLYLGVGADSVAGDIDYTSDATASGFYRRGISDNLTAGGNFQYFDDDWMVGGEGVWGTPLGTFGGDVAYSHLEAVGSGWAFNVSYERLLQDGGGGAALSVSVEARSRYFGAPTQFAPDNRYELNAAASYSRSFGEASFVGVQLSYAKARDNFEDERTIRATYGHRIGENMNVVLDASWTDGGFADGAGLRVSLVRRFGETGSARADYDTRNERARLAYQTSGGHGVGAWSASGALEGGGDNYGFNGAASYIANRAELGLAHTTAYSIDDDRISDQRSSLRAGTSFAFAGERFAIGRPIDDGFVIVAPYAGAPDTVIEVDPSPDGHYARSGALGPALYGQLGSYSPRTITYDAPYAEGGFDIGAGSLRVLAPYRAGYVVTVGSDYTMTAVGRLLDRNGEPVTFIAGEAIEEDGGRRVEVFTNRQGVFGMSGLRPGRWRIELSGQPPRVYQMVVPDVDDALARMGDLRPVE